MDELKKVAVIVFGVVIIIGMGWVLSNSSPETAAIPEESLTEAQEIPLPDDAVLPGDSDRPVEPERKVYTEPTPKVKLEQDTIKWKESSSKTYSSTKPESPVISGGTPLAGNPNPIFVSAAEKILPAVVSVRSARRIKHPSINLFPPFLSPDKNKDKDEEGGEDDEILTPGSGSGILISDDGYIMTNYHVVEDAEEIRVMLYDKREYNARIIGGDPTTDVALVKIDERNLPNAIIGNSDSVRIGEWVMAVGNPLNFTSTVTTGIVSALGRNINIIDRRYRYRIENFIQTDAVINPGNSGGALVNLRGEVVGINTAIATRNGYYQGYGFAIPINLAKKVVNDLIKYGHVNRAILGVEIEPVNDRVAKGVGLEKPSGALIQRVTPGFPAEKAGLRQGDIILAVDNHQVVSVNDLQIKIASHNPGERVSLTIWRNREMIKVDVVLAQARDAQQPLSDKSEPEQKEYERLGLELRELTPEELQANGIESGLLVQKVASGSPADQAGIFPMTLLLSINETPVESLEHFDQIVAGARSGSFLKIRFKFRGSQDSQATRIIFVEVP